MGVFDDRLEWTNVAICLESIFQRVYCTLTVYTPETEQYFYPIPSSSRENTSSEQNHCAVVTPKEMVLKKSVKERILWTRSDSELAKRQLRSFFVNSIDTVFFRRFALYFWKEPDLQGGTPILEKPRSIRTPE